LTAGADAQRLPASGRSGHLALGGAAMVVFLALHLITGRIDVGNGSGWDVLDYATMLRDGWSGGSAHTQLRPLIVWLNAPLYAVLQRPVETFDVMNVIYAGGIATALSMLLQRYGATMMVRAVAILCITLTNHFRLFVFYPVLVDLGACLAMTIALLLILDGPRWAASPASPRCSPASTP
jgi:hypothetical protein